MQKKEIPITFVPPDGGDKIFPPLQALENSPNWVPMITPDGSMVYVWNYNKETETAEAILLTNPMTIIDVPWFAPKGRWLLLWRTRKSGKLFAAFVKPRIPYGGLEPPADVITDIYQFIAKALKLQEYNYGITSMQLGFNESQELCLILIY